MSKEGRGLYYLLKGLVLSPTVRPHLAALCPMSPRMHGATFPPRAAPSLRVPALLLLAAVGSAPSPEGRSGSLATVRVSSSLRCWGGGSSPGEKRAGRGSLDGRTPG